jgi:hypothetical protein
MTPEELVATRIAPFWLAPEKTTGVPARDAALVMGQRYRKADGSSLTQFNTGAIIIRDDRVLALTECQPIRPGAGVRLAPTTKSRTAVIDDVRTFGPPLLAVVFKKAALDVRAWVCSTPDEVVLNGPAGPEEIASMEDVALMRTLPGTLRAWRMLAGLYAATREDRSLAERLYADVDKLASGVGMTSTTTLDVLHRLHRVGALAYSLAEVTEIRA